MASLVKIYFLQLWDTIVKQDVVKLNLLYGNYYILQKFRGKTFAVWQKSYVGNTLVFQVIFH